MRFLTALITLMLANQAPAQQPDFEDKFAGPVKSIKGNTYVAKNKGQKIEAGEEVVSMSYNYRRTYDTAGNQQSDVSFEKNGDTLISSFMVYDSAQRPIENNYTFHDLGTSYSTKILYPEDRIIETHSFEEGVLDRVHVNEVDHLERLISSKWYSADSTLDTHFIYVHSEDGKQTTQYALHKGDSILRYVYTRDDAGNEIGYKSYDFGRFWSIYEREYNESGDLIKEVFYYFDDPPKVKTFEYIYDEHGNWTERIESHNGAVAYVAYRVIEYY